MKITLCGSARFEKWFRFWDEMLTLSGHTVYNLAVYPSDKQGTKNWYTEYQKERLDQAHKEKIDNSDAIFVLNVFGYIGDSTLSEIEYAKNRGKSVYALESWGKGCGVGSNHYEYLRKLKTYFKVPDEYTSPINTTEPNFKSIYSGHELLGPAGEIRRFVVDSDENFKGSLKKIVEEI